jgi:hypothetical protein
VTRTGIRGYVHSEQGKGVAFIIRLPVVTV